MPLLATIAFLQGQPAKKLAISSPCRKRKKGNPKYVMLLKDMSLIYSWFLEVFLKQP
jgi:hypothetical protein